MNYKIITLSLLLSITSCGVKNKTIPKTKVVEGSSIQGRMELINSNALSNGSFQMTLQSRLNPPTLDGMQGQSTSIDIKANKAYVSFNVKGATYQKGAVTVLNTLSTPSIEKEIQFLDQDINYVRFENNAFNIVGAKQATSSTSTNSFFQQFTLDSSNNRTFSINKTVPSFAANHLNIDSNYYYISSGDTNGGLSVFKKSDSSLKFYSQIQDSRSVGIQACGKSVNVLTGINSSVVKISKNKINTLTTAPGTTTAFSGSTEREARSEIISGVNYSIISLGEQGFNVICNEDMSVKAHVAIPARLGIDQGDIRTNGVSAQKGLIFAAQGGAGLYVYGLKSVGAVPLNGCQNVIVSEIGYTTLTANDSVNSVSTTSDAVYTSNGKGGVEIFNYSKDFETDDVQDFDSSYQASTCAATQMIAGCDSVTNLVAIDDIVNVPARTNDNECYSLKIVNYQASQPSSNYTDRLIEVETQDHSAGSNFNPHIMSKTSYKIKMQGIRNSFISGSKYGLSNYYVDNFFFFKLTSTTNQYYAMGTGDSVPAGSNSPLVLMGSTYQEIPWDVNGAGGTALYTTAFDLSTKLNYPINTQFILDSYALDAGVSGETSDMYLIFK